MESMEQVPWAEMGDDLVHTIVAAHEIAVRADAVLAVLLAQARMIAEARVDEMPSATAREREMPLREMTMMVAMQTRMSTQVVDRRMSEAIDLARLFPDTLQSWLDGRVTGAHARVLLDAARPLESADDRAAFEARMLPIAETETPGRLRPLAAIAAAKIAPSSLPERFDKAVAERRVWVDPLPDGMAMLGAILPAMLAHGIHDRLTKVSAAIRDERRAVAGAGAEAGADEPNTDLSTARPGQLVSARRGTLDAIRADVLTDLLLSAQLSDELLPINTDNPEALRGITGHVSVVVTEQTLLGNEAGVCVLTGYGPIDSDSTRWLAGASPRWDLVSVNPSNGQILDTQTYRPTAEIRRYLIARDEHCRRPGCLAPAEKCDIDHTLDWAYGGKTTTVNLEHLCRGDHTVKHATRFTVKQLPDGSLVWTAPNGVSTIDRPRSTVSFLALDDDAPF